MELGIDNLRYHDLRREGASRLFEKEYSIEEVAQVTGHRNLNVLWQLYPNKLHDKTKQMERDYWYFLLQHHKPKLLI